jgi:hypothetical protein
LHMTTSATSTLASSSSTSLVLTSTMRHTTIRLIHSLASHKAWLVGEPLHWGSVQRHITESF